MPYGLCYCPATQRHKVVRLYVVCDSIVGGGYIWSYACHDLRGLHAQRVRLLEACRHGGTAPVPSSLEEYQAGRRVLQRQPPLPRRFRRDHRLQRPRRDLWHVGSPWSTFELTEVGGSLCIYSIVRWTSYRHRKRDAFDVWLLKEYSIAKWEKLCHIGCGDDAPRLNIAAPQHQLMLNSSSWIGPLDMYYDRWSAAEDCVGHEYILATCSSLTLAMAQPSLRSRWPSRAPAHHDLTWVSSRKALHERAPRSSENTSPWMRAWSEVLSRLPALADDARSLNQVCRGWRAIVKSEHFAAAPRRHEQRRPRVGVLRYGG